MLREHFHRWSDAQRAAEKAKGFPAMVARLRAGAPLIPWRLPRIRNVFNGLEFFIHHEDVRRANGRDPRAPSADLEALSWRMIGLSRATARAHASVLTDSNSSAPTASGGGMGRATLRPSAALPAELVLYLSGRRATARVTLAGDGVCRGRLSSAPK